MKKIIWLLVILFSFIVLNDLMAYDTAAAKYMPLQVGNVWVYYEEVVLGGGIMHCRDLARFQIVGISQINGKLFFNVQISAAEYSGNSTNCGENYYLTSRLFQDEKIRIDSETCNLYGLDSCLIDSLAAQKGDSEKICTSYPYSQCDTSTILIMGIYRPVKVFFQSRFEYVEAMIYAKGIGLAQYQQIYPGPTTTYMVLRGCVINGVLYGDTNSLVSVNQRSTEVPNRFSLLQNYPNPFNPKTVIRFQVASDKSVSLKIFDALGKEVETIVNQQLKPGTYEADWDGTNYPSGVYFYQLSVGNEQIATKKMLMVK